MRSPDFVKTRRSARPDRACASPSARKWKTRSSTRSETEGTVVIEFRVEQEDSVYPMVPAGADLDEMIRRPMPDDRRQSR